MGRPAYSAIMFLNALVEIAGRIGAGAAYNPAAMALFRRSKEAGAAGDEASSFIPARSRRLGLESFLMRIVATGGIIGIGTALAAILGSQDVAHWITGLVVSVLTVILAAILWSSRTL